MTVSTVPYFSWSGSGINSNVPPYNACSPNLVSIQDYIRRRWGCVSLGCHVPPPTSTHSHPYGAANDIRIRGTGFDRAATLEAIDFLIAWSAELGINTIHDYYDHQRMWKPAGVGWIYNAPIGSPGGQWIHVETSLAAFGDGRPVEARISAPLPSPKPGDDFMTPEDQKYLDRQFGDVSKQIAAVWHTLLTGRDHPEGLEAQTWLTGTNQNAWDNGLKLDDLKAQVEALALVAGDPDALKAAVAEIVRSVVNDTVLEVRPPS